MWTAQQELSWTELCHYHSLYHPSFLTGDANPVFSDFGGNCWISRILLISQQASLHSAFSTLFALPSFPQFPTSMTDISIQRNPHFHPDPQQQLLPLNPIFLCLFTLCLDSNLSPSTSKHLVSQDWTDVAGGTDYSETKYLKTAQPSATWSLDEPKNTLSSADRTVELSCLFLQRL